MGRPSRDGGRRLIITSCLPLRGVARLTMKSPAALIFLLHLSLAATAPSTTFAATAATKARGDAYANNKPSILFLLADDIGWGDFSYNNGTASTPK